MRLLLLSIIFTVLILPENSFCRTIVVPDDYEQIHVAVEFAAQGDTVLVLPGLYQESVRIRSLDFVVGSLLLTTGDPSYIDETIIDGTGTGNPVVRADGDGFGSALMRGFTITGGYTDYGGGIICRDSTRPVFEDMKIFDNEAEQMGGGAYLSWGTAATFRRVVFDNNRAETGGGVAEYRSQTRFENCVISNNYARSGGGFYSQQSTPFLNNCWIGWNYSVNIYFNYSTPELLRVTVNNGDLPVEAMFIRGGGLDNSEITLDRLTLFSNRVDGPTLLRAVNVNGDQAISQVNLLNSILIGDSPSLISLGDGARELTVYIENCDIPGGRDVVRLNGRVSLMWGNDNIDEDPLFFDPDTGDFHLRDESPCIDSGAEWSSPDPDNSRADMGGIPFGGFSAGVLGQVVDSRFFEPVDSAEVTIFSIDRQLLEVTTNQNGIWTGVVFLPDILYSDAYVIIRAQDCIDSYRTMSIASGGLTNLYSTIEVAPFSLSTNRFEVALDPGDSTVCHSSIASNSMLPIFWSLTVEDTLPDNRDLTEYIDVFPAEGVINSGEDQEFQLDFRTNPFGDSTALAPGEFSAQLRLSVRNYYADQILPINLTVNDLGVDDHEIIPTPAEWIACFPQPFNSTFAVQVYSIKTGGNSIRLYDASGRLRYVSNYNVENTGVHQESIDTTDLPAGIYLLKVSTSRDQFVRKVVCLK